MSDETKPAKVQKAQPVRGMQDFLGDQAARFEHVTGTFRDVSRRFGFRRVEVPVVEFTSVFARTLGETTDVVSKEMYTFEDRNGESLTLRPEFTAGICRAYISEGWQQFAPLKLVTHGPLFRYERPQKGRYRQFHQLDAEVIGSAEAAADGGVESLHADGNAVGTRFDAGLGFFDVEMAHAAFDGELAVVGNRQVLVTGADESG